MEKNMKDLLPKLERFRKLCSENEDQYDTLAWDMWDKEIEPYENLELILDGAHEQYEKYMTEHNPKNFDEALYEVMSLLWELSSREGKIKNMVQYFQPRVGDLPLFVERNDFYYKWHSSYWNGPIDGMLQLKNTGKYAWFKCFYDYCDNMPLSKRTFKIYDITKKQFEKEVYWHQMFSDHVGTHTDYKYDKVGRRTRGIDDQDRNLKPQSKWAEFYSASKDRKKINLDKSKVIGWTFLEE